MVSATEFPIHARNWLFDLDGCIWYGDELAPGAARLVADLRASGATLGFLTNTSSTDAAGVAEKLRRLGIPATGADVVTPMSVLMHQEVFAVPRRVLLVGTEDIHQILEQNGVRIVAEAADAEVVVVGKDEHLTYDSLAEATQALVLGAHLVALNLDPSVPAAGGRTIPGCGAIVAALTTASGVEPTLVGKPSAAFFEHALEHFGMDRDTTVMVGDRADVDIRGANAVGLETVQVGRHTEAQEVGDVPDLQVEDLLALYDRLELSRSKTAPARKPIR